MKKKITILTLGDDPRHLSGVAHCLRDIINGLLSTGNFRVISLGAAIKHQDLRPVKLKEDWVIIPVEGFGTIEQVRGVCEANEVDLILFQSDPRFYDWFLVRDNEIRRNTPTIWYSVWDCYPYPLFNDWIWSSVDVAVAISQLTEDLIKTVSPSTECHYMPHAVNNQIFKPNKNNKDIQELKKQYFPKLKDEFVFFWNNRNGRRKNGATLLFAFDKFLNKVGRDKAVLIMHTDAIDPNGFNLPDIVTGLDLTNNVILDGSKCGEDVLANLYNIADCTVNISNAEGFGMSTLESLSCGTPIIACWTGGLREQLCNDINNPTEWYGVPVFPATRNVVGSPELPWIYEEQVAEDDVVNAMEIMYNLSANERLELGKLGQQHIAKNFNFQNFEKFWITLLQNVYNERGSNPNRSWKKFKFEELTCKQKYDSTKKPTNLPASMHINFSHFIQFMNNWKKDQTN